MSMFHLPQHLLRGGVAAWEEAGKKELDITAAEQRTVLGMLDALHEHEQHRHHHESHMMMPCSPPTSLIMIETGMAFGILE